MSNETKTHRNINNELQQFTGTEKYYRHLTGYNCTDGVHYLATKYECHWLLTEILIANHPEMLAEFQVWKLTHIFKDDQPTSAFLLTCEDGDKNIIYRKQIPFSDFPGDIVELWFCNNVLYLPSEH